MLKKCEMSANSVGEGWGGWLETQTQGEALVLLLAQPVTPWLAHDGNNGGLFKSEWLLLVQLLPPVSCPGDSNEGGPEEGRTGRENQNTTPDTPGLWRHLFRCISDVLPTSCCFGKLRTLSIRLILHLVSTLSPKMFFSPFWAEKPVLIKVILT